MPTTKAYHWPEKMKYPLYYEDRGDRMLFNWGGMPRAAWLYIKDEINGLEGAKWHPDSKAWTATHPKHSLRNRNALGYLTNGEMPGTSKDWLDRYTDPVSEEYKDLVAQMPVEYYDFQKEDLPLVLQRRKILLGYDMGLGKTLMGLSVMYMAKTMLQHTEGSTVSTQDEDLFWVISPKNPMDAWRTEIPKWPFGVKPRLIMNSPQAIRKAMLEADHPPFVLCIDESANFKNPAAQRTQLVYELCRLMNDFWAGNEFVLPMTGTPDPKDPTDWWAQIEMLCPGFIREKNPVNLRKRLASTTQAQGNHGTYMKTLGWIPDEVKAFGKRLEPIRIIRLKKDVQQNLPDKIYIERAAKLDPTLLSAARVLAETMPAAQALSAVRQLSDGFQYTHEFVEDSEGFARKKRTGSDKIQTPKDDMLIGDLQELRDNERNRVIIWGGFQGTIDKIVEICLANDWNVLKVDGRSRSFYPLTESSGKGDTSYHKDAVRGLEGTVDNAQQLFQDTEKYPQPIAFVGNPDAAGEGITLTAADTMIFYSNTFNGGKRQQAEERFHRIGMDENASPRVIDYINLPTDRLVLANLRKKKSLSKLAKNEVLNALELMETMTQ